MATEDQNPTTPTAPVPPKPAGVNPSRVDRTAPARAAAGYKPKRKKHKNNKFL